MNLAGVFFALLFAALGYMTAWYLVARITNRTDVIDTAWGLGFVYLAWLTWRLWESPGGVPLVIVIFVTIWGLRLSLHLFTRTIHHPEDRRYVDYRRKWKDMFWVNAYLRIFVLQGLLLLALMPLAVVGFLVWGVGIICETVADYQLRSFVKTKKKGEIMQTGLWRYSRHPNYFGELASWWGAAIVSLSLHQWWAVIGALTITLLITKVSGIPLLEKHYEDNKTFQKYKKHTSVLIPLPPR
jgi:steroid 5-alpha reductase family enzyme